MTITNLFHSLLAVAAIVFWPLVSTGQDDVLIPADQVELRVERLAQPVHEAFNVVLRDDDKAEKDEKAEKENASRTEYWLGLQVAAVPEIAKKQLQIDHGLAVEDVAQDSPAAKAEIKKFDILLQAGDTPLKGVGDLIKSVEAAKGKQIIILLKRDGESRKVQATAEQRAKAEAAVDMIRKKLEAGKPQLATEIKQLEEAIEKLKAKTGEAGKDGFGMWFAKPAIVAPRVDVRLKEEKIRSLKADFPKDLSVQINKQGAEPTKIHVKRGDQEWEVTEDKLGELPEDIRIHVQQLLGHMKGPAMGAYADRMIRVTPEGKVEGELRISPLPPKPPQPPRPAVAPKGPTLPPPPTKATQSTRTITTRVERDGDGTDAKLDAIMKKLDKLQSEIDQLRDKR